MLTQAQIEARAGKLTASAVGALMSGDAKKVRDLWLEMCGDPEYEPPDWDSIWPVQLGTATEALNLLWYEKKRRVPVTRQGEVVISQEVDWAAATLDGWDASLPGPVECKHVGGREPFERIMARYMPQMQWQMFVTRSLKCAFSVIEAANEPRVEIVEYDAAYFAILFERAKQFMQCVWTFTSPVALPAVAAPVQAVKEYDMSTSNSWATHAKVFCDTRKQWRENEDAAKELKLLVPADAIICKGHGLTVSRNKARALTIKQEELSEEEKA
jgi:hypothetical protein